MLRRQLSFAALTLVATSAISARAAGDAGPAQDALALSREVTLLRTELRQQQDLVLMLRHRLADAETLNAWLPWLVLGLVLALAGMSWLALRGRRSSGRRSSRSSLPAHPTRRAEPLDADDASGPATVFAPGLGSLMQQESSTELTQISTLGLRGEVAPESGSMVLGGAGSMAPPPNAPVVPAPTPAAPTRRPEPIKSLSELAKAAVGSPPPAPTQPTQATSVQSIASAARQAAKPQSGTQPRVEPAVKPGEVTVAVPGPRPVSVDELVDLEQQVDFFLVLGQIESAVDLLVSHIRGTGGNSALPYLKLMEVYRHQGDAESYERTRKRFNQRFNAHAPDWVGDPQQGRSLEQYPEVLERLQKTWPLPLDALADLESMLFRRSRGELFDLPAFREVLLLHGMAVDLHDRSPLSASKVDILLPLGEDAVNPPPPVAPMPLPVVQAASTPPAPLIKPALAEAPRNRLAEWAGFGNGPREPKALSKPADVKEDAFTLDLDLSDFAPAPREYTHPAAFTDLAMRADFSPVPLAAANDLPRGKPPSSSTR